MPRPAAEEDPVSQAQPSSEKLGLPVKLIYGIGSAAYGVKNAAFGTFLLLYYNQVIGLPPVLVSSAIMVALVVDAFSDPIVGQISDNLRTKWGRRHPLMYASAIPAAISFILLWIPPDGLSDFGLFVYLVLVASAVRTLITLYEIPSSALAPELTTDYHERTSIASFRYLFAVCGGIGMAYFALAYFFRPTEEYPVGQLNPAGYVMFAFAGALVMFLSIAASTLGTHKYIPRLHSPPAERFGLMATLRHVRASFSHRGFQAILAFGVLKYTALGMTGALNLYFWTYFWEFQSNETAILTLDLLAGAAIAMFMAPSLSQRTGKRDAALLLAILAIILGALPYVLRLMGLMFPNDHPLLLPTLLAIGSAYSACAVASGILVHAMIGDVVDESLLKTGKHSAGLFYAANSLMQKCVSGLGVMVAGLVLAVIQFPDGAEPGRVDPAIVRNLALFYVPLLAVLYGSGAGFLKLYRLSREDHDANVEEARMRAAAAGEGGPVPGEEIDTSFVLEDGADKTGER